MAEIKAFRGLRYTEKAGEIGTLCCPPYDIISKEMAKEYHAKNPYNIIRLELPRSLSENPSDNVYEMAGKLLREWLAEGVLKNDTEECVYVYEMEFDVFGTRKSVVGFIPLVKVEEISKGIILPHEETLSKDKSDRMSLTKSAGCNFSQIYSLYNDESGETARLLSQVQKTAPTKSFTDGDNVTHKLWVVSDNAVIQGFVTALASQKLYIADGHHRYETAMAYKEVHQGERGTADYVPMMLVNMENDGLVIFPTHRIVRDLEKFDKAEIIAKSAEYFDITENLNREKAEAALAEAFKNGEKALVLYSGGNNYTCMKLKNIEIMKQFMPSSGEATRNLDVSVLHKLVLERIFGIDKENMANQKNLTYTRSLDEAISAVDSGAANCSFLINPCGVSEIRDVVASGEKMPQKSTYFYPKLTTGLVMNQIVKEK